MANEPDVHQDDLDAFQDSSEVRGSMSHRMEHPEEYLEASSEETPEEKEAREAAEAAAAAAEAETPEQKAAREALESETPEQKAAREADEAEADKTKNWTIEDYRKNRKESETRMHTATEETAREKTAREAAEAKAAEAERKLAEKEAAAVKPEVKPDPTLEERENQLLAQMTEIRTKAAKEIADLDRSDPDQYYKDWAAVNSKADLEIKRAERKLGLAGQAEDIGQIVDTRVEAKLKQERDADEATRAERQKKDQDAEAARLNTLATDLATTKFGLDMKNRTIRNSFFDYSRDIPEEIKATGDLEKQVEWCALKLRADLGIVVNQTDEERKLALENQKRNQPLGKGGNPPLKEEFKPKSMSERMESISP